VQLGWQKAEETFDITIVGTKGIVH
jgi:hypothetical protein